MKEHEIVTAALRQLLAAREQIDAALIMVNAIAAKGAERMAAAEATRGDVPNGIVPDDGKPPMPAVFGKGRPEEDRPATAPPAAPPVT